METNATRFISAFNKIDKRLRTWLSLKPSVPFAEVVRKSAAYSAVVRKYEDELSDYSRLRNAIVHNSDDRMIIAEPHDSVVEQIERICEILLSPPLAVKFARKALTLPHSTPLLKAVKTMASSGYSNVPVIKDGAVIGVVTNKLIVEFIAKNAGDSLDELLGGATVSATLSGQREHYEIMSDSVTADEVLEAFSKRPKLQIVILTRGGTAQGSVCGVLTTGDIIKLNELIN